MSRSALTRIAVLAVIWGSAFLWIKLADRALAPVEVTLARLVLGAAVLFAIAGARRESVPRSWRLWGHIAVAALFANAVPYLLFAVAEQSVNSSVAGIINATTPLWTVVLALAVRHQRAVTSWQLAGLIFGFFGGVLIFSPWSTGSGLTSAGGLECLAASVILAIALAVTGARVPHVTATSAVAIAVLGIVGTGLAYVLNYQIIISEGATAASTVTYLLPVIAIVLGVLFLHENVTVTVLAGIALVLAGVALTRRKEAGGSGRPETGHQEVEHPAGLVALSGVGGGEEHADQAGGDVVGPDLGAE